MSAVVATIGLGSNVGDRGAFLAFGLSALRRHPELEELAVSALYETDHVGPEDQRAHWNACARYRTTLDPHLLLAEMQRIERAAGRRSGAHGRPRTLDLDLLLYGQHRLSSEHLQLPHPRMVERRFVLEPLSELDPDQLIDGSSVRQLLAEPRIRAQRVRRLDAALPRVEKSRMGATS